MDWFKIFGVCCASLLEGVPFLLASKLCVKKCILAWFTVNFFALENTGFFKKQCLALRNKKMMKALGIVWPPVNVRSKKTVTTKVDSRPSVVEGQDKLFEMCTTLLQRYSRFLLAFRANSFEKILLFDAAHRTFFFSNHFALNEQAFKNCFRFSRKWSAYDAPSNFAIQ